METTTDLRQRKETYGDIAYKYLLNAILTHDLKTGQRLRPEDIAVRVGLSPTPIRYALARLAGDGLVEFRAGKGPYVVAPSVSEVLDLHEAMLVCEVYAIREGIGRVNSEFVREMEDILLEAQTTLFAMDKSAESLRKAVEAGRRVHLLVMSLLPNAKVQAWYRQLDYQMRLVRQAHIFGYRRDEAVAEHQAIHEALARRDAAAAEEAMRRHSIASRDAFLARARAIGLE